MVAARALSQIQAKPGKQPVWWEEFNETSISSGNFHELYTWGDQNNPAEDAAFLQGDNSTSGLGGYTLGTLAVSSGQCTLNASNTPTRYGAQNFPYRSSAIRTKKSWLYGYFEVRAKMPAGQGILPAIWMMPPVYDGNVAWEIDILEVWGSAPTVLYQNIHWGVFTDNNQVLNSINSFDCSAAFHTYAVDWSSSRIIWYYDGVEVYRQTSAQASIPNVPLQLLCDVNVGGTVSWGGFPDGTTPFPSVMAIDYIRIYQ